MLARCGRYILATNDHSGLTVEELLAEYKAQQGPERGFRFLKDPLFFTSSVFIKTPARVASLAMVMGLSLLVYSLGQRFLRRVLREQRKTVRHQTGKQTPSPTLRWVFQLFQAVHLLVLEGIAHVLNLSEERRYILGFFPSAAQKYYGLA